VIKLENKVKEIVGYIKSYFHIILCAWESPWKRLFDGFKREGERPQ